MPERKETFEGEDRRRKDLVACHILGYMTWFGSNFSDDLQSQGELELAR